LLPEWGEQENQNENWKKPVRGLNILKNPSDALYRRPGFQNVKFTVLATKDKNSLM
jgi:hypothetical protein